MFKDREHDDDDGDDRQSLRGNGSTGYPSYYNTVRTVQYSKVTYHSSY
jgi:hypothetical protein